MMNLGRVAAGGRNWEGFGADPFLSGVSAYETILGMQQSGVQATAKHYINNEQEHNRTTSSSDVDDRTQHELYAQPFLKAVLAGVASVMCSYSECSCSVRSYVLNEPIDLINNTYACENEKMLNDVMKREYGFQGCECSVRLVSCIRSCTADIMSDWSAQHSTISAVMGLDVCGFSSFV
jgi:beta-glucosidase-like glycosyl hydrolase